MSGRPGGTLLAAAPADRAEAAELGLEVVCASAVVGPLVEIEAGDAGPVPCPADALLAWIALSPAGVVEVGRLAQSLASATGRNTPVINLVSTPAAERPLAAALAKTARLESALVEARAFTVELSRGLAALRREHQTVLDRFFQVEARVAQVLAAGRLACDIAASGDPVTIGVGASFGETASMLLPFNISGLSRLELSVVHAAPEARLRLSVQGLEAGEELLSWTRSGEALAAGWNVFTPLKALEETAASGRLWIQVEDGAVTFDTGAPHPLPDLRLEGDKAAGESPLALRAWTSVPGFSVAEPPPGPRDG